MQSLARLLLQAGCIVRGSDIDTRRLATLRRIGVTLTDGHSPRSITADVDLVVHSIAVPEDNPEVQHARRFGIPTATLPECLGLLTESRFAVAVAGTHGKSTTAAMLAKILECADLEATTFVGAADLDEQPCGRWRGDSLVVAEACEYRRSFLAMRPQLAVLLGIEPDHFDYFRDRRDLYNAFVEFAALVPADRRLITDADCPAARKIALRTAARTTTFSVNGLADWQATRLECDPQGYRFRILYRGRDFCDVALGVWGRHNVSNALAAAVAAAELGATADQITAGLAHFRGLARRLERRGSVAGRLLVSDYAHHPSEITAGLRTLREFAPASRICCLFQPHQVSRTAALLDEFAQSLKNADRVFLTGVEPVREPQSGQWETQRLSGALAREIRRRGGHAAAAQHWSLAVERLIEESQAGDIITVMGAGDVKEACDGIIDGLRRNRAA